MPPSLTALLLLLLLLRWHCQWLKWWCPVSSPSRQSVHAPPPQARH